MRVAIPQSLSPVLRPSPATGSVFQVACFLRPLTGSCTSDGRARKHPRVCMSGVCGKAVEDSAIVARTWLELHGSMLGDKAKLLEDGSKELFVELTDMHGQKDGDSLGAAISLALVHYLLGDCDLRPGYVITGAITQTGRLGGVGCIQMKAIVAWRAGAKGLIIPKESEDVLSQPWRAAGFGEPVPTLSLQAEWARARAGLDIKPMETMQDVLTFMIERQPPLRHVERSLMESITTRSFVMVGEGSCAMITVEACEGLVPEAAPPRKPIVTGGSSLAVGEMMDKIWGYLMQERAAGLEGALKDMCFFGSTGEKRPPSRGPFQPNNRYQIYINIVGAPSSPDVDCQAPAVLALLMGLMTGRLLRRDVAFVGSILASGHLLALGTLRLSAFHTLMDQGVAVLYLPQDDVGPDLMRMLARAEAERTDGRRLTLKGCTHLSDIMSDIGVFVERGIWG